MPPKIVADTFEAFEQIGGQLGQSAKQVPKVIAEQAKQSLGLGGAGESKSGTLPEEKVGSEIGGVRPVSQAREAETQKIQKMEAIAKQKAAQRYKEIQDQILLLAKKRQQELPKEVSGKPGFSEEKMIKQLEEEKKPEAEKKKKEEPVALAQSKRKAEMFRGASG